MWSRFFAAIEMDTQLSTNTLRNASVTNYGLMITTVVVVALRVIAFRA